MTVPTEDRNYEAVVCIPTFRRPWHLEKTLDSLINQVTDVRFAVVVVENDARNCDGKAIADKYFAEGRLGGLCVVEAQQGNCHAINRAFATGLQRFPQAQYLLMIDDDEVAAPSWLGEMVRAARDHHADLVGGPVLRIFDKDPDHAAKVHPLFNSPALPSGFVSSLFGSGNCLIARRVFEALDQPEFDVRFNFLGGGDMEFFTRCRQRGFKSYWNSSAIAIETVPVQRTARDWMIRRGVTTGVINYTIDRKRHPHAIGYAMLWAKNLVSLGLAPVRAARLYAETRHWLPALHPVLVSIGRNMAALGFSPAPYKA
jgi:GT2 family glycosyltransferase